MNERIKQLAEQAGLEFDDDTALEPTPIYYMTEKDLEKFAELIVKECMDVAKYHTPETEECEYTWLIHDKIKEHFGVEE